MLCEDVLYKCNAKYPIIHSSHQRGNNENPFVGMAILVHLSLVRRPYNLMPMIGNSFSFTALLNYFLLLLLLCKEVGLAEDKKLQYRYRPCTLFHLVR